jgi:hypothetical protein
MHIIAMQWYLYAMVLVLVCNGIGIGMKWYGIGIGIGMQWYGIDIGIGIGIGMVCNGIGIGM